VVSGTNGSVVPGTNGVQCQLEKVSDADCKALIRGGDGEGLEDRATKMLGGAMMRMFKQKAEASEDDRSWKEEMGETMAGPGRHCPPSHPPPTRILYPCFLS